MRRKQVESSMLKSVGYDPETHILEVEFHHGGIYRYLEVAEESYRELIEASSIGAYFNAHIKDAYVDVRLR